MTATDGGRLEKSDEDREGFMLMVISFCATFFTLDIAPLSESHVFQMHSRQAHFSCIAKSWISSTLLKKAYPNNLFYAKNLTCHADKKRRG